MFCIPSPIDQLTGSVEKKLGFDLLMTSSTPFYGPDALYDEHPDHLMEMMSPPQHPCVGPISRALAT